MSGKVEQKVKKVVYVCWNDKAHAGGTLEFDGQPQVHQEIISCPNCGEVVRIMQKL
jgi:hypothetical protein